MSAGQAPPVSTAVRVTTVAAVVVVALVAAVVSYAHMRTVAERGGEGWRSWLVPLSVDGLVVAGSMVLLARRRAGLPGGWLAWTAVLGGVGASLAANMAVAEPTVTARLVAAWPAIAFAFAVELLLQQRRSVPVGAESPVPAPVGEPGEPVGAGTATPVRPPAAPVVAPVAPFRPGGFGAYPPVVAVRPADRPEFVPPPRPDAAPAVASRAEPQTGTRGESRAVPDRSAQRPDPAPRTGPVRTARTDAQLSTAVRKLAERNGGTPPSAYAIKQALGVGSGRAARLLAELHTTTPAGDPASNGAARKEGTR